MSTVSMISQFNDRIQQYRVQKKEAEKKTVLNLPVHTHDRITRPLTINRRIENIYRIPLLFHALLYYHTH